MDFKQGWKHPQVAKPFVALPTDRRKKGESAQKNGAISPLGAEKIAFPPKPDRLTDRQTDRHTDGRTFAFIE